MAGSGRQIEFPPQAGVHGQLVRGMPRILAKEEKFGLAPGPGDGSYIAANFGRSVKQKRCEVISDARLEGDGGRTCG